MWQGGTYCSLAQCGPGPPFQVASFSAFVLLLKDLSLHRYGWHPKINAGPTSHGRLGPTK